MIFIFIRYLLRALQLFYENSSSNSDLRVPPLGGTIPDMVSTTGRRERGRERNEISVNRM